jgi:hypothetical protein
LGADPVGDGPGIEVAEAEHEAVVGARRRMLFKPMIYGIKDTTHGGAFTVDE